MINNMENKKLNFFKWFFGEKAQVIAFLFMTMMTGISVYTALFEQSGWAMTGFFLLVMFVFGGKTFQAYNDYLNDRSR